MSTVALLVIACLAPRPTDVALPAQEVKIPNTVVTIPMVQAPAGTIEIRGRKVSVPSLWVTKTEITWDAYDVWMYRLDIPKADVAAGNYDAKSRPSRPYGAPDRGFGHAGYAAIGMTHLSAENYAKWLSAKTGVKFRLPTEAEWEYLARAGETAEPANLDAVAWFWDNTEDKTMPVGKKQPNAWGLFDVLGNVGEWATDLDGKPVVCGGSYIDKKAAIRFGARAYQTPKWQDRDPQKPKSRWWLSDGPFVGFRLVADR